MKSKISSSVKDKLSTGSSSKKTVSPETKAKVSGMKKSLAPESLGNSQFSTESVKILGNIYDLMVKMRKNELKKRELANNVKEEKQQEEEDKSKKLVDAVRGPKKKKEKPKQKKKPKKGLSGNILESGAGAMVLGMAVSGKNKEEAAVKAPAAPMVQQPAPAAPAKAEPKVPAPKTASIPQGGGDKFAMNMIKRHEGFKLEPYKDTKGLWTVGVGHLIGNGKTLPPEWNRKFSEDEVNNLFAEDYKEHKEGAKKTPGFGKLNDKGQAALTDLAFNMGSNWYKGWPNFSKAMGEGDVNSAAGELEKSKWYGQVGQRAPEVVGLLKEGTKGGDSAPPLEATATKVPPKISFASTEGQNKNITDPTRVAATGSLDSLVTKQAGVDTSKLSGSLEERVAAMAADYKAKTGQKLLITSAYRSNEKQKELFDAELARNGGDVAAARKKVAEPGPPFGNGKGSLHAAGFAIDINSKGAAGLNALAGPRDKSTGWLESFGLARPVNGEDWHVQLANTPATPDNPVKPGSPVLVANKGDTATDVSTGKNKQIPEQVTTTPKSSSVASVSKTNDTLKDELKTAKAPTVVNNSTTTSQTGNKAVAQKDEKIDDRPIYLRKLLG
jgi:lysozyme